MATKTKSEAILVVIAKESFATGFRTVKRGQLLPANDPIVLAKPIFFAPYQPK